MTILRSMLLVASFAAAAACGTRSAQESSAPDCGDDVRVCADGTPVGRTGPACEFAECPGPYDGASFDVDGIPSDAQTPEPKPTEDEGHGPLDSPD
jgi:hypothetical protein